MQCLDWKSFHLNRMTELIYFNWDFRFERLMRNRIVYFHNFLLMPITGEIQIMQKSLLTVSIQENLIETDTLNQTQILI